MTEQEEIGEILRESNAFFIKDDVIRLALVYREFYSDYSELECYQKAFEAELNELNNKLDEEE